MLLQEVVSNWQTDKPEFEAYVHKLEKLISEEGNNVDVALDKFWPLAEQYFQTSGVLEIGNSEAHASIVVNDTCILEDVPLSLLINLERDIANISKMFAGHDTYEEIYLRTQILLRAIRSARIRANAQDVDEPCIGKCLMAYILDK